MSTSAVAALAAALAVAFVTLAVRTAMARRAVNHRIAALAARVGVGADAPAKGAEAHLAHLERAVDQAMIEASDEGIAAVRYRAAIDAVPIGVVVHDEHGGVVHRNAAAGARLDPMGADAAASAALNGVLQAALGGRATEQTIDLVGPPARVVTVAGSPIESGPRSIGAAIVVDDRSGVLGQESARRDLLVDLARALAEPLGVLGGLTEDLSPGGAGTDPRANERAARAAAQVREVLDEVLLLSHLASEAPRVRELVDLAVVVQRAVANAQVEARRRLVTVGLADPSALGARPGAPAAASPVIHVMADPRLVEFAVGALIEVAVAASRSGGRLEVRTDRQGPMAVVVVDQLDGHATIANRRGLAHALLTQAARNLEGAADQIVDGRGARTLLWVPTAPG